MDGSSARSAINVVMLTPGFPAGEYDTSSLAALQHLVGTLQSDHPDISFEIVAIQFPFSRGTFRWHGIPVHSVAGRGRKGNRLFTWIRTLRILNRLRKEGRADLVHAFWLTEAAFLGALFRLLTRTPLLVTAMGQDVKRSNWYLWLLRPFRMETVLISAFQAKVLGKRKNVRVSCIIPFGVKAARETSGKEKRSLDILGAGSLNKIKNYPEFLEVVEDVAKLNPGLRCQIVGQGKELPVLADRIRALGLEEVVTLSGPMEHGALQELMYSSRVFLHTSLFEGQGLVITEALAAGMYVVCYPVGSAWRLHHPNLMTGNNVEELAALVTGVLSLEEPDHAPKIQYKIEDTCREYALLYRSLLHRS